MHPELVSLMQQLVTAVQSIALSVDVMSVDLRALNRNVAQLVQKDLKKEPVYACKDGLPLAPECSYTQHEDDSSQIMSTPGTQPMSVMDNTPSYHSPDLQVDQPDSPEKSSPGLRETLREDIKKAMERSLEVEPWKKDCRSEGFHPQTSTDDGRPWEACTPVPILGNADREECPRSIAVEMEGGLQAGAPSTVPLPDQRLLTQADSRPLLVQEEGGDKKGKTYKCVWCGREFSDSYKLKRHWRVHTGEKPFSCFQCGKAFAYKEKLIIHRRLHTGERPFPCEVCGKAFRQKGNLIVHMRLHTGERPYTCDVCGKAFKDCGNLSRHKRLHVQRISNPTLAVHPHI